MNVKAFYDSLDEKEKESLYYQSIFWKSQKDETEAKKIILSLEEKKTIDCQPSMIPAIKMIRERTGAGLVVAKKAAEMYKK